MHRYLIQVEVTDRLSDWEIDELKASVFDFLTPGDGARVFIEEVEEFDINA